MGFALHGAAGCEYEWTGGKGCNVGRDRQPRGVTRDIRLYYRLVCKADSLFASFYEYSQPCASELSILRGTDELT